MSEPEIEYNDRYTALGIPEPDPATICVGMCEGTGIVPVDADDMEEPWRTLWLKAEEMRPNAPGDRWHLVICPTCDGTGITDPKGD